MGDFLKFGFFIQHKPLLTALKRAGYKVDEVEKQEKRTVITISSRSARKSKNKAEVALDAPGFHS